MRPTSRHRRPSRLLSLLALALPPLSALAQPTAAPPPNVLVILSDDHSAPHVGCYGNPDIRTPNLDRLAADGIRFDRAYVACPQCVPSRAAILTGRHPVDIGMTRFTAALPRDVATFPELLRQHRGYFTGLAGRSYHLTGRFLDHPAVRPHLAESDLPNFDQRYDYVNQAGGADERDRRREILRQFQEFLSQVPAGKPFFLQLSFSDPHRPFTRDELPHEHDPASLKIPPFYPDDPAPRRDLAYYYDEIGRLDASIGQVLRTLDERNLAANTLVIFMGDNGGSQLRGKGTLNEFGIRVPLIARWPGHIKPGSSSPALVSGEDLAPTVLELLSLPAPDDLTGVSFLPLLRGEPQPKPRAYVISERGPHGSALPRASDSFDLGRSIVTDRYKLIYNATWQIPFEPVDFKLGALEELNAAGKLDPKHRALYFERRPMFELYDLREDPHEMANLAGTPAAKEIEADLKGRLTAWMIRHRDFVPLPLGPAPRATAAR